MSSRFAGKPWLLIALLLSVSTARAQALGFKDFAIGGLTERQVLDRYPSRCQSGNGGFSDRNCLVTQTGCLDRADKSSQCQAALRDVLSYKGAELEMIVLSYYGERLSRITVAAPAVSFVT